jgi:hypothetical protein
VERGKSVQDVEKKFHQAMVTVYESAKRETGYNAVRFLQMLSEQGGVATARQLLHSSHVSDGFTALWERRRLDLAVEAVVLQPEYESLFSYDEREIARERLLSYGYGSHR